MRIESKSFYQFGPFRIDTEKNLLYRGDNPVSLPPKVFETLLVLVLHSEQVVTKDDLMKALWPDSFVEEANLTQNVFLLRKALGETAHDHRYIVTVPGKGYRFVEKVRTVTEEQNSFLVESRTRTKVVIEETETGTQTGEPSFLAEFRRNPWAWVLVLTAAAVIVVPGTWLFLRGRHRPALGEADLVLVADFVNTTGEPIFDRSLKQAVSVKLAESPYFNVALDQTVRETLGLMGRPQDERVVPPLAREVCERMGAKVVVGGSIVALGGRYSIGLDAADCLTGSSLAHSEVEATSRDQVLKQLGQIITPLRRKLGESIATIRRFDTPILQATTPSLAALKAYSTGDDKRLHGNEAESIPDYRMAIDLDPNFAIAYARLSAVYRNLGDSKLADDYLREAFERREHVSTREKFYIAVHYYVDATAEIDKAIEIYELWAQTYPHDWIPFSNLANELARIGQPEKAVAAGREALRLNPEIGFPYSTLATAYALSNHFAEAKAVSEKAIGAKRDSFVTHFTLYYIGFVEGDEPGMQREIAWFKGRPTEAWGLNYQAQAAFSLGQVRKARELWEKSRRLALQNDFKEYAVSMLYLEAVQEAEVGNAQQARALVNRALQLMPDSPDAQANGALALARAGDFNRAQALAASAGKLSPRDLLLNKFTLPCAQAAIEMDKKNPAAAIEALRSAEPYDLADEDPNGGPAYYRGVAYLQSLSGKEAAVAFEKVVANRGVVTTSVYWPLAHLGLARAYALTGDGDKSLTELQKFLSLWKDADTGLPVLEEAEAEYDKLERRLRGARQSWGPPPN